MYELGNIGGYFKPQTEFGKLEPVADFQGMGTPSFDISQGAGYNPEEKPKMELMENDGKYTPTTEFGGAEKSKFDFSKMADVLKSIIPADDTPQVSQASHRGGGFRFDKSLYENPLIAREYQQMYMEPLYKNLI